MRNNRNSPLLNREYVCVFFFSIALNSSKKWEKILFENYAVVGAVSNYFKRKYMFNKKFFNSNFIPIAQRN